MRRLSSAEKKFVITIAIFIVIVLGLVIWWENLNINPVASIPTPTMPITNAKDYYVSRKRWLSWDADPPNPLHYGGPNHLLDVSSQKEGMNQGVHLPRITETVLPDDPSRV